MSTHPIPRTDDALPVGATAGAVDAAPPRSRPGILFSRPYDLRDPEYEITTVRGPAKTITIYPPVPGSPQRIRAIKRRHAGRRLALIALYCATGGLAVWAALGLS